MPDRRPNILLVTLDQWRGDAVGHLGAPVVRTPVADALAARGVSFARHFVQATPCGPSRACLHTGLYQMTNRVVRNGALLDARYDTLAAAARRAGYRPAQFGHVDQVPDPSDGRGDDIPTWQGRLDGFDIVLERPDLPLPYAAWLAARGLPELADPEAVFLPAEPTARPSPAVPRFDRTRTEAAFMVEAFSDWLDGWARDEPFFAHLSFFSPHPPWIVPDPYRTLYDPADGPAFRQAPSARDELSVHPVVAVHAGKTRTDDFAPGSEPLSPLDWSEADFRQARATYWGMVTETDHQLGRLLDLLETAGLAGDTIVVLTSDHGEQLGDRRLLGKFGFYDESYHVPLIIADPRRPAGHGRVVTAFSETVDLFPTLLDLFGGSAANRLDGRSLRPWLDGETPRPWRDAVHWEYDYRDAARAFGGSIDLSVDDLNLAVVRTADYKYVAAPAHPPLLFDLGADPEERVNRAGDPAYLPVQLAMAERLLAWRARHLDRRLTGFRATDTGIVDDFNPPGREPE